MEENKGLMYNKNKKLHVKDRRKKTRTIWIGITLFLFVFFFSSNLWMPTRIASADTTTKVGEKISFSDNREATLLYCEYSKEQETIEVMMEFSNKNYDGIDDYYYAVSVAGGSNKNVVVDEVVNDELISVIRIVGIKKFDEIQLLFAPKKCDVNEVKDADTGTIILNKHNLKTVSSINKNKTLNDYRVMRFDIVIDELDKKLAKENTEIKEKKTNIEAMKTENENLEKNKEYMTGEEIKNADIQIAQNNTNIEKISADIIENQNEVDSLEKEIKDAKEKRQKIAK